MHRRIFVLGALAAFSLAAAEPQIPDTPAGHQFAAWLAAFNDPDSAAYERYAGKYDPNRPPGAEQRSRQFREQTGGFKLIKVEEATTLHFSALLQERSSPQYARISMDVEEAEPHRIAKIGIRAVDDPNQAPPKHLPESELLQALRAEIDQEVGAARFAGTVLVAQRGKPIFTGAYGFADREKKIPNKLDTRFRIGSMNKMFTATAILQLVQAGKIQLNDPLGKYLTDYPNKNVASKVTIHHLLTHTGGTGDFFGPEFDAHRLELRELKDYVKLFGQRDVAFEPGSRWEYSNYGFLLLGLVVEKASGQDYYDYVREHIYKPAGMTSTDSLPENEAVPDRSIGYTKMDSATWQPNTNTLPVRGTSAGGGYSTVEDLLRFANAITGHKLLNEHFTELLITGKVDARGGKYGYGFGEGTQNGQPWFGHAI